MRTIAPVLLMGAVLLAGCQGDSEPADPPSSQDSLTTATPTTSDAAPTTEAPADDVEQTTAPSDTVETTEASGPPVMPEEAQEDSEAGAEVFALHYVDLINYTSKFPEVGLLEPLAADGCASCENHEAAVSYMVEHGEWMEQDGLEVKDSVSLHRPGDSEANVRVQVRQVPQEVFGKDGEVTDEIGEQEVVMDFELSWVDNSWTVLEIRVDLGEQ